ncbi:MAG: hypothetical protein H7X77_02030 [Anaerolineae bacterium]|nr:hypothetical protein [Anaerolineae bacterium]
MQTDHYLPEPALLEYRRFTLNFALTILTYPLLLFGLLVAGSAWMTPLNHLSQDILPRPSPLELLIHQSIESTGLPILIVLGLSIAILLVGLSSTLMWLQAAAFCRRVMFANLGFLGAMLMVAPVMEIARQLNHYNWGNWLYLQTFIVPALMLVFIWLGYQILGMTLPAD